jgi:hypothetical protein
MGLVCGEEGSLGGVFGILKAGTNCSTHYRVGNRYVRGVVEVFSKGGYSENVRRDKGANSFNWDSNSGGNSNAKG